MIYGVALLAYVAGFLTPILWVAARARRSKRRWRKQRG
jgi:hypothetical protein